MVKNEAEKKSTREARKAGSIRGTAEREKYLKLKKFALEHEKENFSKLFVIHEKGEWWKMVGNSAIIFHYELAKRTGMRSKLLDDSDFDIKSKDGIVNIKNIIDLDEKLNSISIHPLEIKPDYRVYNIGKKYAPSEIEMLKKTKELEWGRVNKVILPKTVFPEFYMSLRELLSRVYFSTRIFEPYVREIIGKPMVEKVAELIREYSFMTSGEGLDATEFLGLAEDSTKWIIAQMTIVSELRFMEPEKIYRILQSAEKVKRNIEKCRAKKAI